MTAKELHINLIGDSAQPPTTFSDLLSTFLLTR